MTLVKEKRSLSFLDLAHEINIAAYQSLKRPLANDECLFAAKYVVTTLLGDMGKSTELVLHSLFYSMNIGNISAKEYQADKALFLAFVVYVVENYALPENMPYHVTGKGGQRRYFGNKIQGSKTLFDEYLAISELSPLEYLNLYSNTHLKRHLLQHVSK